MRRERVRLARVVLEDPIDRCAVEPELDKTVEVELHLERPSRRFVRGISGGAIFC